MSAFEDFNEHCFEEAGDIFGMVTITIEGHTYPAILDQFSATKEQDIGGIVISCDALCMVKASLVAADFAAPLEVTLDKKRVTIGSRTFRIVSPVIDELTLNLALINPNQ